jgi:putative oxidoreductase
MMDWASLRLRWQPHVLSILRMVVGLLFLEHGLNKMFDFPATATHHPYVLLTLVPGLAGLLETVGGLLIVLGLFTRPTAFILSGQMALAYFMAHAARGFFPLLNGGERTILYCFIFLYFFMVGAGVWSLDALRSRRTSAAGLAAGSRA